MYRDFKEIMSQKSDEELQTIVTNERTKYNKIALEQAEEEISKRGIQIDLTEYKRDTDELILKHDDDSKVQIPILDRLSNYIVDTVAIILLTIVVLYMMGIKGHLDRDALFIAYFISFFLYYIIGEAMFQKTIGKVITNTKVIREDNKKPKIEDIIIRTLSRLVPLDNLSYLVADNGIHDYLSNTKLVLDS